MGQKEKLLLRLKSRPKDFTFSEAETLLGFLGFSRDDKGRTSGSRVMFFHPDHPPVMLHRPHPRKELLAYQVHQLIDYLQQEGIL